VERTGLSRSTIRDVFKGIRIKFYSQSIYPGNEVFCVALREEALNTARSDNSPERQSQEPLQWPEFCYNGSFHRIPKDFNLPKGEPIAAWQLWLCGNRRKKCLYVELLKKICQIAIWQRDFQIFTIMSNYRKNLCRTW
jgi:hypothetical protein